MMSSLSIIFTTVKLQFLTVSKKFPGAARIFDVDICDFEALVNVFSGQKFDAVIHLPVSKRLVNRSKSRCSTIRTMLAAPSSSAASCRTMIGSAACRCRLLHRFELQPADTGIGLEGWPVGWRRQGPRSRADDLRPPALSRLALTAVTSARAMRLHSWHHLPGEHRQASRS